MSEHPVDSSGSVSSRFERSKRALSPNALASPPSPSKRSRLESEHDYGLVSSPARAPDPRIHRLLPTRVDAPGKPQQSFVGFAARRWFEESNNDVFTRPNLDTLSSKKHLTPATVLPILRSRTDAAPFYLKDSPFGLDSAYALPSQPGSDGLQAEQPQSYPILGRDNASGSIDDDYRSVIDDLTVENKKLKKRLRKYEKLHCSHLQQEKLFEVRAPGLPECEKQELETVLRRFAASLDDPRAKGAVNAGSLRTQRHRVSTAKPLKSRRTPADSAYASNSASDMIIPPTRLPDRTHQEKPLPSTDAKHKNVESHMEHMPQAIVPWLSDEAKMKMIVGRLEQVFTGKSATWRGPRSSQQQHEISTSAAMLENSAGEIQSDRGMPEGFREARILPADYENLDSISGAQSWNDCYNDPLSDSAKSNDEGPPGQRPTRPMDLDLNRPQVGADNMEYIRHLGLASPVRHFNVPDNGEGWVYLNLLSNMAQLHTFNVTSEFVRKAIAKSSSGFDLSPDGQQVRWRDTAGMASGKSDSSDGSRNRAPQDPASDDKIRNLRAAAQMCNTDSRATLKQRTTDPGNFENARTHDDEPLFIYGTLLADSYSSNDSEPILSLVPSDFDDSGQSNGFEALQPSNKEEASSLRKSGNGPIIFYRQATFCTDLSGHVQTSVTRHTRYARFPAQPLGQRSIPADYGICSSERSEKAVRVLSTAPPLMAVTDSRAASETEFDFPDIESLSSHPCSDGMEPLSFEASGLAGIKPEDNFLVDVAIEHTRPKRDTTRSSPFSILGRQMHRGHAHHSIAAKIVYTLTGPGTTFPLTDHLEMQNSVLSTKTTNLPPSSLPQPSYIYLPFSSSDSDDGEADESESVSDDSRDPSNSAMSECRCSVDDDDELLPTGHLRVPLSPARELQRQSNTEDEHDSDESIDLLAYARSRDRWAVAAWEMDYDADGTKSVSDVPANGSASEGAS